MKLLASQEIAWQCANLEEWKWSLHNMFSHGLLDSVCFEVYSLSLMVWIAFIMSCSCIHSLFKRVFSENTKHILSFWNVNSVIIICMVADKQLAAIVLIFPVAGFLQAALLKKWYTHNTI